MAEYEDNLQATQQSAMPEFYVFTAGATVERYTTFSRSLNFLGQEFVPASIKRSGISYDTKFGEVRLNITTPITANMAKYIPNTPIEPVEVIVYRSHIDYLAQYEVFFKGKIKTVQFERKQASAQCVSSNKFLTTKIPTIIYQAFCNHDVYDDGCQVDPFAHVRTCNIVAINDNGRNLEVQITAGDSWLDGDMRGGKINFGTDIRFITGHLSAYVLQLHVPFDGRLQVGSQVYVYPGCDGNPETCRDVFNNLDNFLGMPYIPSKNPVVWGF